MLGLAIALLTMHATRGPTAADLAIDSVELSQDAFLAVIDLRIRNRGDRVALLGSANVEVVRSWELGRTDLAGLDCKMPPHPGEVPSDRTYWVRVRAHERRRYVAPVDGFARRAAGNDVDRFKIGLQTADTSDSILLAEVVVSVLYNGDHIVASPAQLVAIGDQDILPWLVHMPAVLEDKMLWARCPPDTRGWMPTAQVMASTWLAHNRAVAPIVASSAARPSLFASRVIAELLGSR